MAATPERKVKQAVVSILESHGAYWFYPVQMGMGRAGIPDIVVCYRGQFIGIECKAGKGKPTALQSLELSKIEQAAGKWLVVNEDTLGDVVKVLESIRRGGA